MKPRWQTGMPIALTAAAVVFGISGMLRGQTRLTPTGRVAVVDVGKIFNEYQKMKDATEELRRLEERLRLENEQRKQRADALEATVNAMDRDDPAYVKKMQEVLEARIAHKTWFEFQQANSTREIALATDRIYRDILRGVEQVARESGYDVVLYREEYVPLANPEELQAQMRSRKVVYASDAVDITQVVLDRLNAEYRAQPPMQQIQVP